MSKVVVMDHPLIQHKIGYIRRIETGTKDFRQTMRGEAPAQAPADPNRPDRDRRRGDRRRGDRRPQEGGRR